MRSLLRLLVLLCCVQRGHALPSLLDHIVGGGGGGDSSSLDRPAPPPQRPRRSGPDAAPLPPSSSSSSLACGLRSVQLRVRDLGLGYAADETVLFRYCGGACDRARSNHDLTLAHLLHGGVLPRPGPGGGAGGGPCCRPTHHEDLAFLDNAHRWHKVEKLLAAGCSCVG